MREEFPKTPNFIKEDEKVQGRWLSQNLPEIKKYNKENKLSKSKPRKKTKKKRENNRKREA